MALPTLAAVAGSAAVSAYLDAKLHIRHDLAAGSRASNVAAAQSFTIQRAAEDRLLVYHNIEAWAQLDRPNHLFLEFEGKSWTYKQFFADLQRVGNWLMNDLGIQKQEIVAMSGPNTPEHLMLCFALHGIGACASLVNCTLTGQPLLHIIQQCDCRYFISDRTIEHLVGPCQDELCNSGITTLYYDQASLASLSDTTPLPRSRTTGISPESLRTLMYSSGTTGLPKAVQLSTARHLNTGRAIARYLKLKPKDKIYTCLPLYHGAAHGLCVIASIHAGSAVVLGRKFSHKTFWPEVSTSGANILQYVGELCRYLTNAPYHPLERQHKLQMAWGNGIRPDVWENFRQRFNIPVINELYGATDGMGFSFNANRGEFSRNAIGIRGALWHYRMAAIEVRVRIDIDTEEVMHGSDGFAIRCKTGETGEVLTKIDPSLKQAVFEGYYKNETASEKRWMSDVFQKGDLWFRSGDMMRLDAEGRLYFVDRLGDTFRWKSENISTNEVSDVLGQWHQIAECNVYGVSVPNGDGRCGCAAIVLAANATTESLDLTGLADHAINNLPRYAVPLFLRVTPQLSYTGTFKIQKGVAKREGVNLESIEQGAASNDVLFWLPPGAKGYEAYRGEEWASLQSGRVKL